MQTQEQAPLLEPALVNPRGKPDSPPLLSSQKLTNVLLVAILVVTVVHLIITIVGLASTPGEQKKIVDDMMDRIKGEVSNIVQQVKADILGEVKNIQILPHVLSMLTSVTNSKEVQHLSTKVMDLAKKTQEVNWNVSHCATECLEYQYCSDVNLRVDCLAFENEAGLRVCDWNGGSDTCSCHNPKPTECRHCSHEIRKCVNVTSNGVHEIAKDIEDFTNASLSHLPTPTSDGTNAGGTMWNITGWLLEEMSTNFTAVGVRCADVAHALAEADWNEVSFVEDGTYIKLIMKTVEDECRAAARCNWQDANAKCS